MDALAMAGLYGHTVSIIGVGLMAAACVRRFLC